jgi:type IV pilus assembly protein PilB
MALNPMGEKDFVKTLAQQINIPYIDLETAEIDPTAIKYVSEKIARTRKVIPISVSGNELRVAMADTLDFQTIDDIRVSTGLQVIPVLATSQAIDIVLGHYYRGAEQAEKALQELQQGDTDNTAKEFDASSADIDSAPIVRIVNSILTEAVNMKASDIHIEPFENEVRVRIRVDGDLNEIMQLPKSTLSGIVTRIKIMADLNIAETKRPQDGSVKLKLDGRRLINMRISLLPTVFGEKTVIRLLNNSAGIFDKSEIGLSPFNMAQIERLLKISEGIILLTGPTGSGKSTTLYSMLKDFNTIDRNIITLEDPVEYQMFGINQVQVNTQVGMTFASGLRSILRQDPDIIMLGEIRDEETAEIAIRSAITGHIVLSTLHTNDTVSSISRLVDLGIQRYMVTSAVAGIVAQRLLKRICPRCAETYAASETEKKVLGVANVSTVPLRRGKGCPFCGNTGYKGRTAIHEVLVLDQEMKSMINANRTNEELKQRACQKGMKTLADSARELVLKGTTTIEEMLKATYDL